MSAPRNATKAALPHGEYLKMIEEDLPFNESTARKLVLIARDNRLTDRSHVNVLPPDWGTLYEITRARSVPYRCGPALMGKDGVRLLGNAGVRLMVNDGAGPGAGNDNTRAGIRRIRSNG